MRLRRFLKKQVTWFYVSILLSAACLLILLRESRFGGVSGKARHNHVVANKERVDYSSVIPLPKVNKYGLKYGVTSSVNRSKSQQGKLTSKRPIAYKEYLTHLPIFIDIIRTTDAGTINKNQEVPVLELGTRSSLSHGKLVRKQEDEYCRKQEIVKRHKIKDEDTACKPHKAPQKACKFAQELYQVDEELQTCRDNSSEIYCKLQQRKPLKFVCPEAKKFDMCKISVLHKGDGVVHVLKYVSDMTQLEVQLARSSQLAVKQNSPFVFLQCFHDRRQPTKTQLILLPILPKADKRNGQPAKPDINVVLLDSIARAHFYRSLPVVLEAFNHVNKDRQTKTEILDFELFQSVHGHSAENFHAFFSGKLLQKNLTDTERERAGVEIDFLYRKMQNAGYETMYQDDVCWKYWWGMRLELGSPPDWESLKKAIEHSYIDHTGLSFASCKILADNRLKTPFNGPEDSQICFNGRFQHSYIFEHLLEYFQVKDRMRGKPRVSFTTINTAHDYKGLRIQTLNHDLAKFTKRLANMQNTLTILLADHGNTYTKYTSGILEGRFEMHHPSFFMIVPEGVQSFLGKEVMAALRINTKRLFTMVDLHKTVLAIAKKGINGKFSQQRGLLGVIPATRQCSDLDLALPNLCVCEGWDTPALNDTKQIGILEFAVGTLNNMIEAQRTGERRKGEPSSSKRKCHRLYATSFTNVRERSSENKLITTMDFAVQAGAGSSHTEDVFHVEVQSTIDPKEKSRNMKLLTYDRISQYGIYRKCKDATVNVKLCICSLQSEERENSKSIWESDGINLNRLIKQMPRYRGIPASLNLAQSYEEECIYVITRNYVDKSGRRNSIFAAVIEIINACAKEDFEVLLTIENLNCKTSSYFPKMLKVRSQTILFAAALVREVWYWESTFNVEFVVNAINPIGRKIIDWK